MTITKVSEDKCLSMIKKMETLAWRIREIIVKQPPLDLIGYIYASKIFNNFNKLDETEQQTDNDFTNDYQLLLEYVHATLVSTPEQNNLSFDESACTELFGLIQELKKLSYIYAMTSSINSDSNVFGPNSADIEFQAKYAWILVRGNRYQVLEKEFYSFVLAPHDNLLRELYGVSSNEIAVGFQNIADAVRTGHSDAIEEIEKQFTRTTSFADTQGKSLQELDPDWVRENLLDMSPLTQAFEDMFYGGVCNLSQHTNLPKKLLSDLAYERAEETDFFDQSEYSGTPYRTLPVRKKPLIKLYDDYYAIDPCFIRDSGYRALLWNLLQRKPDYKKEFEDRQKIMSELAFFNILEKQLQNATVYQEIYYKDPITRQWVENDLLILIDDVLIQIEAKAGAAATIASPAVDFKRHIQAIQDLVIKAYKQTNRFFVYLASNDEVPIFKRENNRYVECTKLRRADYRLMFPIGLTIESFTPFSAMCKTLPDIKPILGKHPFISLSIDDLLVLKRFLPTLGMLTHYLEVRQAIAGKKKAFLFDELDHLGAYIQKNRLDQDIIEQEYESNPDMLIWNGMSKIIDEYFQGKNWGKKPIPAQNFPIEILKLLSCLEETHCSGWLLVDNYIRNYGEQGRNELAAILQNCRITLNKHPHRYFSLNGEPPLFVWLQRPSESYSVQLIKDKAGAVGLALNTTHILGIFIIVDNKGNYIKIEKIDVDVPTNKTEANAKIYEDSENMKKRVKPTETIISEQNSQRSKKLGRNEPCWCGSGLKYKKCHG